MRIASITSAIQQVAVASRAKPAGTLEMTPQGLLRSGRLRIDPKDRAAHIILVQAIRTGVQQAEIDRKMLLIVVRERVVRRWTTKLIRCWIAQLDGTPPTRLLP